MTPRQVLSALEALAGRLGVVVRAESFSKGILQGHGGLCWVDGKPVVLMDDRLALTDRVGVLAAALVKLPLGNVLLPAPVREALDRARPGAVRKRRKKRAGVARASHPGLARAKPR